MGTAPYDIYTIFSEYIKTGDLHETVTPPPGVWHKAGHCSAGHLHGKLAEVRTAMEVQYMKVVYDCASGSKGTGVEHQKLPKCYLVEVARQVAMLQAFLRTCKP